MVNTVFSYSCKACKFQFDISFEKEVLSTEQVVFCPLCGKASLYRDYKRENKSVHFKGSGFYSTDNKEK